MSHTFKDSPEFRRAKNTTPTKAKKLFKEKKEEDNEVMPPTNRVTSLADYLDEWEEDEVDEREY